MVFVAHNRNALIVKRIVSEDARVSPLEARTPSDRSRKDQKMMLSHAIESECVMDQKDLLTRCMGNKPFAARILDAFLKQLNSDLDELEAAIHNEDATQVAIISHRVKGASSNVSARRLNFLAASIAELAKNNEMGKLQESCLAIRDEQQQFIESAKRFADSVG